MYEQKNYTITENFNHNDPYELFLYALKAPETKRQYPKRLKIVFDYFKSINELTTTEIQYQCKEVITKTLQHPSWLTSCLIRFIMFQKERIQRKEIVAITAHNYIRTFKLFIDMNFDIPPINWKRLTRGLPAFREVANDRAPTVDEIRKLIQYPDRRIKAIILLMVSGGFRLGAWDYLKWKHVIPIKDKDGSVTAAKLLIYAGEPEEYYSFISKEAYASILEWIRYRIDAGENVIQDSWLMRNMWQTTSLSYGAQWGLAKYPKQLKSVGVKSLIDRAARAQGLIKQLENGQKRREWKIVHGYRKFFKSRAEQIMKPINVEILLGHNVGLSGAYYRPTENEILNDYLKAADELTINGNDDSKLKEEIHKLTQKNENNEYMIKAKFQEKDDAILLLSDQVMQLMNDIDVLKKKVN